MRDFTAAAAQAAPPHTRGWTPPQPMQPTRVGGSPAHAGMDPTCGGCSTTSLRLPRTRGWPRGVYAPPPAFRLRLVVIPSLPRTRDTLLMRLMGRGRALREAIDNLERLPDDAWERGVALDPLVQLWLALPAPANRTDDEKDLAMSTSEVYERWKKQIREEGEKSGVERGIAPLERLFERRLDRVLTQSEHAVLRLRLDTLGPARLGDVVLDLDAAALGEWLKDPAAG